MFCEFKCTKCRRNLCSFFLFFHFHISDNTLMMWWLCKHRSQLSFLFRIILSRTLRRLESTPSLESQMWISYLYRNSYTRTFCDLQFSRLNSQHDNAGKCHSQAVPWHWRACFLHQKMDMVHDASSFLRHLLPILLRWRQCQVMVNDYTRILALETPALEDSSSLEGTWRDTQWVGWCGNDEKWLEKSNKISVDVVGGEHGKSKINLIVNICSSEGSPWCMSWCWEKLGELWFSIFHLTLFSNRYAWESHRLTKCEADRFIYECDLRK